MRLYFLRHGAADWPDWPGADDDRPLNAEGARQARLIAEGLRRMHAIPDLILTSPLLRAFQTAGIVADELGVRQSDDPALAPGCTPKKLWHLLERHPLKNVMLVGHEPDFSHLIESLTGARVKLAKTGVALVDLETGKLLWLFPPKVLGTAS
ncbi:MAG: SixA phosphatase family protein [Chthoniobacteraceae bacterium]